MASEARLLRASREGDQQAFGRIVRRYQSLVCAITYSSTGDLSASEDLAQETFITAWKKLDSLGDPSRLRGWLCTMARNLAVDWLRRRQRDVITGAVSFEQAGPLESTTPTPVERSLSEERASLVWGALNQMPEDYRIPLILYYREKQSVGHVAEALDLSRSAVKMRLLRGRSMLKDKVVALVEETLTTTRPGDTFAVAVVAALAGVAGKKAAGVGSTILGLSLAKAAVIGTIAVGAAVGGGLAVQHLVADGQTPVAAPAVAAETPQPGPPTPQPAVIYAERLPKKAAVLNEMDIKSWLAMLQAAADEGSRLEILKGMLAAECATKDPSTVDLGQRLYAVSLSAKTLDSFDARTTLFRVTDTDRYLANLFPEFRKDRQEGQLQLYTNTETWRTKRMLLVDPVGRWAVLSWDLEEARVVMQMLKDGELPPARPVFPDARRGLAYRLSAVSEFWDGPFNPFNALRQSLGIPAKRGNEPQAPWAVLIDAVESLVSRQVETAALCWPVGSDDRDDVQSLKMQFQPVAGTPLAECLAAGTPGGLRLLKYVPADSLAVLASRLPDLARTVPSKPSAASQAATGAASFPARLLGVLGDEMALAVGRSPNGPVRLFLALKVKDPKAAQALTDELAGLLIAYLSHPQPGQPALPLRLSRSETVYNGHTVKVWDFDLTIPLDQGQGQPAGVPWAALVPMVLGKDLKVYEVTIDDTFILAFGDGAFEQVKQMLDGRLADLEHAARFTKAMAGMPAQPQTVGYLEAEKLAAWLVEVMRVVAPGRPELRDVKFEEGLPVVLASHVIGKDVIEVPVRLPSGALRTVTKLDRALFTPRAGPTPPAASPQVQPKGLHGPAAAGTPSALPVASSDAAAQTPKPDPAQPAAFNSAVAFNVYAVIFDGAQPQLVGNTPSERLLAIPPCQWWYVEPLPPVDIEKVRQEVEAQSIPGLTLHDATDAGMEHLKGLTALQLLGLGSTRVTDAGLEHVKGLTALRRLDLGSTQVTDAGLQNLKELTRLQHLNLSSTYVTDAGLERLKGLAALQELNLAHTKVTDAGLEHLKGLTALQSLNLYGTKVTDAGLEPEGADGVAEARPHGYKGHRRGC